MDIIAQGSTALTKPQMISFVHDVKDLEVRAFTLENTAKALRKEADRIEKEANNKLQPKRQELKNIKLKRNCLQKERKNATYRSFRKERADVLSWRKFLLSCIIPICLLFWIPYAILEYTTTLSRIKYNRYIKDLDKKIEEAVKADKQYESAEYIPAKKNHSAELAMANAARAHADELENSAAKLHEQLDKLYALNVVPPSYRRLVCVVLIEEIFINDQADTMREATLLCDAKIRHDDVMTAFRELAETMHGIRSTLEYISREVSMMSQDVFQMAQTHKDLLSETQSARYAAEAVHQSVENLNRWEEIKYFQNT